MQLIARWLVAILFLALAHTSPHAAGPDRATITASSKSVVQIRARGCPDRDRVGTGFLWQQSDQVVTTLHVLAGCQTFSVYYEHERVERDARLHRSHRRADLALLVVENAPNLPVLKIDQRIPDLSEDLVVLGYELGSPTMGSKSLRVSFGSATLGEMVPSKVRQEIERIGIPSTDLVILRLEGHLLPGMSGAPIIDQSGKVVAVADGGLERGAASVSWGIRTTDMAVLPQSDDGIELASLGQASSLFSADLQTNVGQSQQCGQLNFTKLRTRRLEEIFDSSDDPAGLQQILSSIPFPIPPQAFDIYVNSDSGATVVVPEGTTLNPVGSMCQTQSASGAIQLFVQGTSAATLQQSQIMSVAFENDVIQRTGRPYWQVDPAWSYLTPQPRFDGLVVNRKAAVGSDAYMQPTAYGFETLMTRGTTFAGVAAINIAYNPQVAQYCFYQPGDPNCAQFQNVMQEWVSFILGVHLSTFPIG